MAGELGYGVLILSHPASILIQVHETRGGLTRSYALPLMNIPRTKNSQQRELEMPDDQDLDGFGGLFTILKASRQSEVTLHDFVTSKQHSCGF